MILLAAIVSLTNAFGTVSVDTHGARVASYVPAGGEEVFFVSETVRRRIDKTEAICDNTLRKPPF